MAEDPGRPADRAPTEAFLRGQDFVARCIADEPGSRDEFVEDYGALVRFAIGGVLRARSVVLPPETLDELYQNVMLSFFERDCRRLKMYEGRNQASFATFIRVCASRQTMDFLRQERRRPTMVSTDQPSDDSSDSEPRLAERADPSAGPEQTAATTEMLRRTQEAITDLAPREQLLIRLHFVQGLEVARVAKTLGISENATHVLKSRIRTKLKKALAAEPDSHGRDDAPARRGRDDD